MPESVTRLGDVAGQLTPARDGPLELGAGLGDRSLAGRGHGLVIYRISPGLQAPRPAAAHASRPLDRPSRGPDRRPAAPHRTGRYIADLVFPGALHAAFVRSALPHARIDGIGVAAALEVDGVEAVLTAAELPHVPLVDVLPIEGLVKTPQHALAAERARFAGEAVALVLATGRYEAEDGAELVQVEYEPLPHVVDAETAAAGDAPLLFPELGSNVVYRKTRASGDPETAFAEAAHVTAGVFRGNRYAAVPIEARGCAASYEPATGELTFWSSTQSPHLLRRRLAMATGIGEARIRVITPDVGGGFGQKIPLHPEELAVALAARETGRTVVWIEDRRENLIAAPHAKEQLIESELALGPDGEFLALRARIVGDAGAYSYNNASALIEPYLSAGLMPGVYRIRNLVCEVLAVLTNKAPVAPYRGVGWTAGHCARELLIDQAARELGIDPVELRRRNMVRPDEFPYESCTGMVYDSGSFQESLTAGLDAVDYDGFRSLQRAGREEGRLLGIGVSPYVEPTGWGTEGSAQSSWVLVSHDAARVTVEPSGEVTVAIGTPSQGQGHGTTIAQIASDVLGVAVEDVTLIANDTAATPISIPGTRASRTAVVLGGAVLEAATELRERLLAIAGFLLEADPGISRSWTGASLCGTRRAGPSRSVRSPRRPTSSLAPVLPSPRPTSPPRRSTTRERPTRTAVSSRSWRLTRGTGRVRVSRIVAVEDCGTMINPEIVEGQVRGAVAQGIGGALLERLAYDEDGQPTSSTLMDYLLPSATEVPAIEVLHCVSPSPLTPGGIKGMGESGLIATPAAVANAVADALAPYGARIERLPLSAGLVSDLLTT